MFVKSGEVATCVIEIEQNVCMEPFEQCPQVRTRARRRLGRRLAAHPRVSALPNSDHLARRRFRWAASPCETRAPPSALAKCSSFCRYQTEPFLRTGRATSCSMGREHTLSEHRLQAVILRAG